MFGYLCKYVNICYMCCIKSMWFLNFQQLRSASKKFCMILVKSIFRKIILKIFVADCRCVLRSFQFLFHLAVLKASLFISSCLCVFYPDLHLIFCSIFFMSSCSTTKNWVDLWWTLLHRTLIWMSVWSSGGSRWTFWVLPSN